MMNRYELAAVTLVLASLLSAPPAVPMGHANTPASLEGFVAVNGVRLQYLDWGGSGPALILIHGLGTNPHNFDDLAPAFTDRFHVIAYARRGSGASDVHGPYDSHTLTEDLRGLMDALGIAKADLVGYSAGGNEITQMATDHPERVDRIIYFDGAYDFSDPEYRTAYESLPPWVVARPASAMVSFDAFRSYEKANWYRTIDDMGRVESYLRESIVIQRDGSLQDRTPKEVTDALFAALYTTQRDYTRVKCPALAIYAEHALDLQTPDIQQRAEARVFEEKFWGPFQVKSIDKIRREIANVEVVRVADRHANFFYLHRQQVVTLIRQFLGGASLSGTP